MKSQNASDTRIGSPLARLRRALSSLATSPGDNPVASNAFPAHAENLVVEFDEAYTGFVEGMDQLPSESQLLALQAVDTSLAAMVRIKDASLWTADAFRGDPRWNEVRALAEAAIGEYE